MNNRNFIPEAVLFDFDGTLARLTLDFQAMRQCAHAALQGNLSPDLLARYDSSKPVMEALGELTASCPEAQARDIREVVEQALIAFEVEAAHRSSLFPFTLPVLERLKARGIPAAIITRNCRQSVNTVFPKHSDYCASLVSRHDVKEVKPHPEHLLAALRPLGVSPDKALMIGDHAMDIMASKNTGCRSAGVLSGEADEHSLRKAGPDWLARDIEELMRLLGL